MVEGVRQLNESGTPPETDEGNLDAAISQDDDINPEPAVEPEPEKPFRRFFWTSIFLLTATASAALGAFAALVTPLPPPLAAQSRGGGSLFDNFSLQNLSLDRLSLNDLWKQGLQYKVTRPVNILIMGIDEVPGATRNSAEILAGRTDTMLLVQVDPITQKLNVLSIPRDTQVIMQGYGAMKINQANVIGGPSLAARIVSRTLSDVPIDRYVRVSTESFREIVDLVGGVEVFVPEPMEYSDYTQNLHINLAQGWQTLNGDQAEQFARFRNDGFGDIGRVQRQQQLLTSLRDRLISPAVIPRIPQIIRIVQRYVDTNLSVEEMLALVSFGLNLDQEAFRMVMLPGEFSDPDQYIASYWLMDPEASERIVREYFNPPQSGIATLSIDDLESSPSELRIAVQNASGEPFAAQQMVDYLQQQGFYNVYVVDNWPDEERQTEIIVQRGDLAGARTLESVIGLGRIVSASTGNLESDLTIRVGEDWMQQRFPESVAQ